MPRMSDFDKKAKQSALKKMGGKFFNFLAPSPDIEGDEKKPSMKNEMCMQEDCVNRDGSPCTPEQKKERCKDDDE